MPHGKEFPFLGQRAPSTRTLLQEVDEETGRKGVAECKRAQSAF